ncbi:hypothetical protein Q7C18_02630 [Nesterenkonia sp. CL21]|uniref:hypothetical protein n=1 Tax=Nesterenkonia sp. CL21 TaxID=3064894 RepID=UPI002879DA1E|nr:hypothetical protein [Nesterenkonia sp. CL21]MDS2171584.1 hypothetical protein [Nesterenkonia sp. CL21]
MNIDVFEEKLSHFATLSRVAGELEGLGSDDSAERWLESARQVMNELAEMARSTNEALVVAYAQLRESQPLPTSWSADKLTVDGSIRADRIVVEKPALEDMGEGSKIRILEVDREWSTNSVVPVVAEHDGTNTAPWRMESPVGFISNMFILDYEVIEFIPKKEDA